MQDFNKMYNIANESINKTNCLENTQAIVFLTGKSNVYSKILYNAISDKSIDELEIINELKEKNDTLIVKLLCVWENGGIDLPSYKFRKMLIDMNADNNNTIIFVQSGDSIIIKEIKQTLT